MSDSFDPYLQWLGIRDPQRPPTHYQLLGLAPLENDRAIIANAADRQMAHVRTFQSGKQSAVSQTILNEIARAKVCLLNDKKKSAYDEKLRASEEPMAVAIAAAPAPRPAAPPRAGTKPNIVVAAQDNLSSLAGVPKTASSHGRVAAPKRRKSKGPVIIAAASVAGAALVVGVIVLVSKFSDDSVGHRSTVAKTNLPDKTSEGTGPLIKTDASVKKSSAKTNAPSAKISKKTDSPKKTIDPPTAPNTPGPWDAPRPRPVAQQLPKPLVKISKSVLTPLVAAREAMAARQLTDAAKQIATAKAAAKSTDEQSEVSRLALLLPQLKRFWNAVALGGQKVRSGDTLRYRDTLVTVTSIEAQRLILKAPGGAQKTFDTRIETVDPDLAVSLAAEQLKLPASLVVTGTFLTFDDQGRDLAKAKLLWQDAGRQAMPVELIMSEVQYDYSQLVAFTADDRGTLTVLPVVPTKKSPEVARQAIPSAADRAKSLKIIRGLYGKQFGTNNAQAKAALAAKLLQEGIDTADDVTARYVLFDQAIAMAIASGDVATALAARDELVKRFAVDLNDKKTATRLDVLGRLASSRSLSPEAARKVAEVSLSQANEAITADQYDEAAKSVSRALLASRKARDGELVTQVQVMKKRIDYLDQQYARTQTAMKTLRSTPDDPAANLQVGRFYCLGKNDFKRGLPLLAKGGDDKLSEAANLELTNPTAAPAQVKVGDAWRNIAKKSRGPAKETLKAHASQWYESALPKLQGITKTRVETRLIQGQTRSGEKFVDLLKMIDPKIHAIGGTWSRQGIGLVSSASNVAKIALPIKTSDDYRLQMEFTRTKLTGSTFVNLPVGSENVSFVFNAMRDKNNAYAGLHFIDKQKMVYNKDSVKFSLLPQTRYQVEFRVELRERTQVDIAVFLSDRPQVRNGVPFYRWRGPLSSLRVQDPTYAGNDKQKLSIGSYRSACAIHAIRFARGK